MTDQKKKVEPTRPQIPSDTNFHQVPWKSGQLPVGGYRSVFPMNGGTKTSGGGKKVY